MKKQTSNHSVVRDGFILFRCLNTRERPEKRENEVRLKCLRSFICPGFRCTAPIRGAGQPDRYPTVSHKPERFPEIRTSLVKALFFSSHSPPCVSNFIPYNAEHPNKRIQFSSFKLLVRTVIRTNHRPMRSTPEASRFRR